MVRISWPILLGLFVVLPAPAAEQSPPAGNWKLTILESSETPWLLAFEKKDDKWLGKINATSEGAPEVGVENVAVAGESLKFDLTTGKVVFRFQGKISKGSSKQIYGTLKREGTSTYILTLLDPTTATSFADVNKEAVANAQPGDAKVFSLAISLLKQATEKKAKPEEVRGWAEKANRCAEPFGPEWQREIALRIADTLADQKDFATAALENARKAERLVDGKDPVDLQLRVAKAMVRALKAAGKTDDLKEYQARIAKIEEQVEADYAKKMIDFQPEAFKGRKEKSDRAVLVELFTGSECPPCVGADLGFEALGKSFKPSEVVLLQYHLHIPRPDPMTNPATNARAAYYQDEIEGTPTILFNGKVAAGGGAAKTGGKKKYDEFRAVIEPLLEKPAQASLKAKATLKDGKIDITAEASDLQKTGEEIRLRAVLVEKKVMYAGGNGIKFHHHVVRDMPGGAQGLALPEKTGKLAATVELEELRKKSNAALDNDLQGQDASLPDRPMDFRNLVVVAFVQNDKTKEVLQAVQVDVVEAK
jgi:hypothetical protein